MVENEAENAGSVDLDGIFDTEELAAMSEEISEKPGKEKSVETPKQNTTEDDDPDALLEEEDEPVDDPEKVGGKGKDKGSSSSQGSGASPDLYSSIAADLVEEGALSNLTPEEAQEIKTSDDLINAFKKQLNAMLDESQQRIHKALEADVEPSVIKQYEGYLSQLNKITPEDISANGDNGEKLRRSILMRDFMTKGFSKEKAEKFTNQSFAAGTDVEDAKDSLNSLIENTKKEYNGILAEAEKEKQQEIEDQRKKFDTLKTQIMDEEKVLGQLDLDKKTRSQIFNNATRIIHTDPETGETYTALEKFQMDDPVGFLKLFSTVYTLTDGGKNLDKLIAQPVSKAVQKKVSHLEKTLNNTQRGADGSLQFINHNGSPDKESRVSNWDFDVS